MDQDRWKRLSQLFHESLEQAPEAREGYLREACADDPSLVEEVLELISSDDEIVDDFGAAEEGGAESGLEGTRVGRYRIVREHARGGMGRVFLAQRADGVFDQTVALKVLHSPLASPILVERFRRERQILARLQHPHIATLLDGGVTDQGQPYLVLEFVEGIPLDEYCDQERLSVDERLALFRQVCAAVVYAHANLVVHRDLKPDNILATEDGSIRLLDFGIAKLIVPDDEEMAKEGTKLLALTPAYASPEQVRGEPVGTATDVYSLGIILYELLTGLRPYEFEARSATELERVVCSVDPPRPSTKVGEDTPIDHDAPTFEALRSTDTRRLRNRLRGDLDVICLKALRKEPTHRYGSVQELMDDLDRHLSGRPVRARPATLGYRLEKAVRRHAWAIGAAAAVLLTSSTLVAFYTARLANERDRAQTEAAKAGEVADFLQGLFEVADPEESLGATITARELLDAGAARIDEGLVGQPEVQATMLRVIGEVYSSIGLAEDAEPLLARASELSQETYGATSIEHASTRLSLAATIQDRGAMAEAEAHFLEALVSLRGAVEPTDPRLGDAMGQYAFLLETDGRYEKADSVYLQALAQLQPNVASDDPRLISVLRNRGNMLRQMDRLEEAEPMLRGALQAQRLALGPRHPDVAGAARSLAALLRDRRAYEEAEQLYLEALEIRREVLGPYHPDVSNTLSSYAILLSNMGRQEESLAAYREVAVVTEQIYPEPHPSKSATYHNLATQLSQVGQLEEAERHFLRSIALQEEAMRPGHPNRAFPRVGLATVYRRLGRPQEAEALLREALELRVDGLPAGHRHIGEAMSDLAAALMDQERYAEAEPLLVEAYETLLEGQGPEAGRTRTAHRRLVELYEATGRPDAAAELTSTPSEGTPE